jgi:cytochrome c biogenesis factor
MTTYQKPARAVVTSAMREVANGFLLVLGLVLYLLGPVGILFGIPLIVAAFAPSRVKKVVAIVYLILVLAGAALMFWQRAQQTPQVQHDHQIRKRNELVLQKLEHENGNLARRPRVRSEAWR